MNFNKKKKKFRFIYIDNLNTSFTFDVDLTDFIDVKSITWIEEMPNDLKLVLLNTKEISNDLSHLSDPKKKIGMRKS